MLVFPDYRSLLATREGDAARLVFNRPERRNALTHEMMQELSDAFARITAEVEDDGTLAEIGRASWKKPSPASIKFGQVLQSARKIFIYEELGPNDGWCTDPNGQDDFPSGRHGNRKGGTMVMGVAEEKGSGNHCFFDGHVEGIPPIQLIRDLRTHKPLTVRGVAGF